jgi:predicted amidohydrolase
VPGRKRIRWRWPSWSCQPGRTLSLCPACTQMEVLPELQSEHRYSSKRWVTHCCLPAAKGRTGSSLKLPENGSKASGKGPVVCFSSSLSVQWCEAKFSGVKQNARLCAQGYLSLCLAAWPAGVSAWHLEKQSQASSKSNRRISGNRTGYQLADRMRSSMYPSIPLKKPPLWQNRSGGQLPLI